MKNLFVRDALAGRLGRRDAYSLAELLVAITLFVTFVASAVASLVQLNRSASAARLTTLALAAAQEKLDQIMTVSWQTTQTRPALLTTGTTTETNLPLNDDPFATSGTFGSAFSGLDFRVNATRVTVVSNRTTTNVALPTRMLRGTVTVSYTYRNRSYSYSLSSLRTADNI